MATNDGKIWIGMSGKKYGPYSEESVRQWLAEGKLASNTNAWRRGMADWVLLATIFPATAVDAPLLSEAAVATLSTLPITNTAETSPRTATAKFAGGTGQSGQAAAVTGSKATSPPNSPKNMETKETLPSKKSRIAGFGILIAIATFFILLIARNDGSNSTPSGSSDGQNSSRTAPSTPPIDVQVASVPESMGVEENGGVVIGAGPTVWHDEVNIISKIDHVVIQGIVINRGNCRVPHSDVKNFPLLLAFGEVKKLSVFSCNISEVAVLTDHGTWTVSFESGPSRPGNVYEAVNQQIHAKICALDSSRC